MKRHRKLQPVSVNLVQSGKFEQRTDLWHANSYTGSKRFQIANFMYPRRAAMSGE